MNVAVTVLMIMMMRSRTPGAYFGVCVLMKVAHQLDATFIVTSSTTSTIKLMAMNFAIIINYRAFMTCKFNGI